MEGLNSMIEQHPAAVVLSFGFLWAVLAVLVAIIGWFVRRELARLGETEKSQNEKLEKLEREIRGEEGDLRSIEEKLTAHIKNEEKTLEAMGREVTSTARAVIRIEASMPNGDMKVAIAKLDMVSKKLDQVDIGVATHNDEAEKWKRTISTQGVRLEGHSRRIEKLEGEGR